jgi:hypothetical protein
MHSKVGGGGGVFIIGPLFTPHKILISLVITFLAKFIDYSQVPLRLLPSIFLLAHYFKDDVKPVFFFKRLLFASSFFIEFQ